MDEMDEVKALEILKKYGIESSSSGVLTFKGGTWASLPEEALEAVSYLFDEWDFVVDII